MASTVVVCFRTSPQAKLALGKHAHSMGLTLAELCQATMLEVKDGIGSKPKPAPAPVKVAPAPKSEQIDSDLLGKLLEEISSDRFGTADEFIRKWKNRYKELLANPNSPAHPIERPAARKRATRKSPVNATESATEKPKQPAKTNASKPAKTPKSTATKPAKTAKPKSRKKPVGIIETIANAFKA